jgi:hypothetical protein
VVVLSLAVQRSSESHTTIIGVRPRRVRRSSLQMRIFYGLSRPSWWITTTAYRTVHSAYPVESDKRFPLFGDPSDRIGNRQARTHANVLSFLGADRGSLSDPRKVGSCPRNQEGAEITDQPALHSSSCLLRLQFVCGFDEHVARDRSELDCLIVAMRFIMGMKQNSYRFQYFRHGVTITNQ